VHRDVKPQNVLISSEGAAKITDFGIARPLAEDGLTLTGRVLATTDYIAPEQALGEPVSGQSDLYSLGVVLYEMLVGDVPFHGESAVAVAMRHVREQLPDVQVVRPGVSAATAAVVDRATVKDPQQRYADADAMVGELEDALALEAARSGQATGEVTSVLRTLPGAARQRLPLRMRRPGSWAAALALFALVLALALIFALGSTHRGVGAAGGLPAHPGLQQVLLSQSAAHSYNPFGTGPENRDEIDNVIDGDPSTSWSTEQYFDGTLAHEGSTGTGTGIYLDAAPGVAARAIEIQTSTPGFALQIYVANSFAQLPYGDSTPLTARGWHGPVASSSYLHSGERVELSLHGGSWRYFLLWLTALPPASQSATIEEVALFK
jgi:eukaryotic-like serine/threonine-protein kinase